MSSRMIFAANLRRERARLGLTQEKLGESADLDRAEVSRLERGLRDPQLATIEKLAIGLDIPAGALLDKIPQRLP